MAPYIQLNTSLRASATAKFEEDLFKLMNTAVFGKTMENLRYRVDLFRDCEIDWMRRLVADPAYLSHKILDGKNFNQFYSDFTRILFQCHVQISIGASSSVTLTCIASDFGRTHAAFSIFWAPRITTMPFGNELALHHTVRDAFFFDIPCTFCRIAF